jgi:general secretion pathway protein C
VVLALILAGVLAWQSVQVLWLVLAGPEVASDPVPPVPQIEPAAAGRDGYRWDLFGQAPQAVALPQPVPSAQTDLQLRGLMSGGDGAFAIVADARGNEAVYRVGDELPDGSRLSAIEPFQILIQKSGRESALVLERELSTRPARTSANSAVARSAPNQTNALPGIRGFQSPTGISAASLQQLGSGSAGLADQISVLPVAGGGYRVRPGRDATLFAELGLQVNDVVTAVNGQPLTSRADAQALFADVLRRGEVSITITRQGREMTLRPDLTQILSRMQ